MIKVRIQQIAREKGITSSYQLQKATGWPPGMCARLWKENWTNAHLGTLNTLCNLFNCSPNDILCFTIDPKQD